MAVDVLGVVMLSLMMFLGLVYYYVAVSMRCSFDHTKICVKMDV